MEQTSEAVARGPSQHDRLSRRIWHYFKAAVICLFVAWHLFFLLVRNSLDIWGTDLKDSLESQDLWASVRPVYREIDLATWRYGNLLGVEQDWCMFGPPMGRHASFLAVRLEFTDGTDILMLSPVEPAPTGHIRFGGWRLRKLEKQLLRLTPEKIASSEDLPVSEAYVRWYIRRWHEEQPED